VTERQSAMNSLRANATIMVLCVPTAIGIAGPVAQCQCSELAMLLAASWAKRGF
jgi:hypothetical protein